MLEPGIPLEARYEKVHLVWWQVFKKANDGYFLCMRPYHIENTSSRPITEVKQYWAMLVLGWVTAWEYMVLHSFFSISTGNASVFVSCNIIKYTRVTSTGELAQMVERSLSMWEVGGSIPPFSNLFCRVGMKKQNVYPNFCSEFHLFYKMN